MNRSLFRALFLLGGLLVSSVASAGFSLADSFLPGSDPNSNNLWTAGAINAAGEASSFQAFDTSTMVGTVEVYSSAVKPYPVAAYNTSAAAFVGFGAAFAGFETGLHPGFEGEYGVFRFAAPVAGTYDLNGDYHSVDTAIGFGNGVEVFVRLNSSDLSTSTDLLAPNQFVTVFGQSVGFNISGLLLTAGQTVDFLVGAHGNFFYDATGVTVNVTHPSLTPPANDALDTPEPGSITLLAAGIAGIGAWRVRTSKRKAAADPRTALA